jgi:hypothetical protein
MLTLIAFPAVIHVRRLDGRQLTATRLTGSILKHAAKTVPTKA